MSDRAGNLYRYANGNPVTLVDPSGWFGMLAGAAAGLAVGGAVGGLADLAKQLARNGGRFECVDPGELGRAIRSGALFGALVGGTFGLAAPAGLGGAVALDLQASGLGDLTVGEVNAIQNVVNQAGRPLEVVGSAARGARTAASDIDYIAPPSSLKHFEGLGDRLPSLDPNHGIIPGYGNPNIGPVIRFEPKVF